MDHQLAWEAFLDAARRALRQVPDEPVEDPVCRDRLHHVGVPRELSETGLRCPLCHPRHERAAEPTLTERLVLDVARRSHRLARAAQN